MRSLGLHISHKDRVSLGLPQEPALAHALHKVPACVLCFKQDAGAAPQAFLVFLLTDRKDEKIPNNRVICGTTVDENHPPHKESAVARTDSVPWRGQIPWPASAG